MATATSIKKRKLLAQDKLLAALAEMSEKVGVEPVDVMSIVYRRKADFVDMLRLEAIAEWASAIAGKTDASNGALSDLQDVNAKLLAYVKELEEQVRTLETALTDITEVEGEELEFIAFNPDDLPGMTKDGLIEVAETFEIDIDTGARKADILAQLVEWFASIPEEDSE